MPKITPFLWFDNNAEEAVAFYRTVFKNSSVRGGVSELQTDAGPKKPVTTIAFTLEGQDFVALNGGPHFKFNEAISFVVDCQTQAEVDAYWDKLCEGGTPSRCGWLKDKFGVSWQVVPRVIVDWLSDPDRTKAQRTMAAMLKMSKLEIDVLKKAHDGE